MPPPTTPEQIAAVAKTHLGTIVAKVDAMSVLVSGGYESETGYYRAFLIAASQRLVTLFTALPLPPP